MNFSTGATITVASLNLNDGGILTGSDTVGVSGLLTWTEGTMYGPATTVAEGGLDLGLSGGGHETLGARTLINEGTATWVGSAEIDLLAGSTFTNEVNATFDDQANNATIGSGDGTGLFDNQGTFVVNVSSTASATITSQFNNEGQLQIESGMWENDSPAPPTPLDATTEIDEGVYEETGSDTISSLDMTGGSLVITGTLIVAGPLNMSGGSVVITGAGTLTVTGAMTWTGGYIVGPGTLIVDGGLTLGTGTGGDEDLWGATLINQSTITCWTEMPSPSRTAPPSRTRSSTTSTLKGTRTGTATAPKPSTTTGTIEKTAGTGTTTVNNIALVNDGIGHGQFRHAGPGGWRHRDRRLRAAAQTTLEFGHSSWAFNSTSNVTGAGTVEFSVNYWPSFFNANSVYDVSGATVFESQEPVDFLGGSVENLGSVTLENGTTLDLSSSGGGPAVSADSAVSLTESSGAILTGSDQLTVSGQINWTGGTMSGTGTTIADGTLQLGASGDTSDVEYLTVRTLDVAGGGTLEPLDTLEQSYGSNFVNTATDTLDVGGGVNWESTGDGTATIDNQGALIVGVEGESVFTAPTIQGGGNFPFLTCPGAIGVYVGGLNLDCDGSATLTLQASFSVLYPCTLQFGGDFTLEDGAGIGGAGNVEVPSGGELWVTSTGFVQRHRHHDHRRRHHRVRRQCRGRHPERVERRPDRLGHADRRRRHDGLDRRHDGRCRQHHRPGGLQIGLPSDTNDNETLDGRTLTNAGTATWAGGGSFSQLDGATFVNQANASLDIDNGLTWYSNDGTGTIANAGTLLESASGDTTTLEAALDNTGSVKVEQGTLSLQGGGALGGTYLVLAGATLTFPSATGGTDNVTTTSVALPSDFTAGPLNWTGTFTGSGSGLASVGVSLFNGHDYYNGTAFESPTQVFNPAALSSSSWTYTILTDNFKSDLANTVASDATADNGATEPSTITSLLLAPATVFPTVAMTAPANGTDTNNNKPTLAGTAADNTGGSGLATVQFEISSNGGTTWNDAGSALTAHRSVSPSRLRWPTVPTRPVPSPPTTPATARPRRPFPSPSTPLPRPSR